jgi:carboxypeptidase Q
MHNPIPPIIGGVLAAMLCVELTGAQTSRFDVYRSAVDRIVAEATSEPAAAAAWNRLAELTDNFPARLSGSVNLDNAIRWSADRMQRDSLENVRVDPVLVPHWVRGDERADVLAPYLQPLAMAGLGGSIGTPVGGLEAEALVVQSFDELDRRAAEAKGKIVVFNVPFRTDRHPAVSYQEAVVYRSSGASRAAAHGAVAALVRSIGPSAHRTPHTGSLRYSPDVPRIPAAAISAEDAEMLQRMHDRGAHPVIRLKMGAQMLADASSGNVVAEIRGREVPNEVVVVSGHIDSWDLGPGAMDDAGGCIAAWEALRVIKKLHLTPRRTIRLILFTNEENGTRGGNAYREKYSDQLDDHVLMLESDNGVLPLEGWGFVGSDHARRIVTDIAGLLKSVGGTRVTADFSGADIQPSVSVGVPGISPDVDMRRYFAIHHTAADTPDKIVPAEMGRLVAAIASMAFVVADMPERLPR